MASGPQSKSGASRPGDAAGAAAEFTRMFSEMKLPAMPDMEAFIAASRRNLETLTAANRVAMEGAQAVARRNMEIMQQNLAELTESIKALAQADGPQAKAAKQAELLKQAYERAVANMQELRDLITQSNAEALAVLNKRFAEAMDEVRALAEKR
jgi:phasin family protein